MLKNVEIDRQISQGFNLSYQLITALITLAIYFFLLHNLFKLLGEYRGGFFIGRVQPSRIAGHYPYI